VLVATLAIGDIHGNLPALVELLAIEGLQTSCVTPDCLCTHAGLDPSISGIEAQPERALVWGGQGSRTRTSAIRLWSTVITTTPYSMPKTGRRRGSSARTIGIDTIAHGVLTAIRLPEGAVFQSARHAKRALAE
jgi:hypothetical protein